MIPQGPISPNLVQLADDVLNGRIDADGVRRLEVELRGNAAAQEFFRRYCQLHVNLRAEAQAQRVIQVFASVDWEPATIKFEQELSDDADRSSYRGVDFRKASRRVYGYVFASAGMIALLAAGFYALRPDPVAPEVAVHSTSPTKGEDVVLINIVSAESRWLPIKDVGKLYIQGPAQLELIGSTRVKLTKGRVRVRITDPRGRGFVVETPQGQVTDLGTEFGVDVSGDNATGVVVFEGEVNLAYERAPSEVVQREERLVQGQGLNINASGESSRIMSIVKGNLATFRKQEEYTVDSEQLIIDVDDNIRAGDVKSFYEIVPRGLKEDALAFVDRPTHEWNGVDKSGMPAYLLGADYVKPFNSDKMRKDVELTITLARPARLFVFLDERVAPPEWLTNGFRDTGDKIGLDCGPFVLNHTRYVFVRDKGPGVSINVNFSVWEQIVPRSGKVRLGPNSGSSNQSNMYGLAAVPLELEPHALSEKPEMTTLP